MKTVSSAFLLIALCLGGLSEADAGTVTGTIKCTGARDNADVIVFIEQVDGAVQPPDTHAKMDQKGMKFLPHVLPIMVGTTVDFLNSDNVMHNVFTPDKVAEKFNLGTWPQGDTRSYTFKQEGSAVLLCNVHPEMEAWVVVLQNPYFAVTDKAGKFSIVNVPAGTYTLKLWHEKLKKFDPVEVTVPAEGSVEVALNLKR